MILNYLFYIILFKVDDKGIYMQPKQVLIEEELISRFHRGDRTAFNELLHLYQPFITFLTRKFFCKGLSQNDLFQEGSVGLYKAVLRYDPCKGSTFKSFAETNIKSMIISAVQKGNRLKHSFLNFGISLYRSLDFDPDKTTYIDFLPSNEPSPEEHCIKLCEMYEKKELLGNFLGTLSELEKEVLSSYVHGSSYREIAIHLGVEMKAVDNALTRIKRKISDYRSIHLTS